VPGTTEKNSTAMELKIRNKIITSILALRWR
jgi:hypothetical protein